MDQECSGKVLDLRLKDHWLETHQRHCAWSLCLVMIQHGKTGNDPDITEKLLTGHKALTQLKHHLLKVVFIFSSIQGYVIRAIAMLHMYVKMLAFSHRKNAISKFIWGHMINRI